MLRILRLLAVVAAVAAVAGALAACSPALNWREVQPAGSRLQALLPCKPEASMRRIPLDGRLVEMHLAGCDADGATFVIGWTRVAAPRLGAALGAWQDATLERAGIAPGPDAPAGRAFVPPGAIALPQALRLQARGRAPDGRDLPLQAAWFGAAGDGSAIEAQALFAAVYGEPASRGAADTFFDGLRLR